MVPRLVDETELEAMAVVANTSMNRERSFRGRDGYAQNLRLDPVEWLTSRADGSGAPVSWLDLCCGTARAVRQAAALAAIATPLQVEITGVDLVSMTVADQPGLTLVAASLRTWQPPDRYDLITCVHGLHYIGDKLGLLSRVATWLTDNGRFIANFDADSIRTPDGRSAAAIALRALRGSGFTYDARRRLIARDGPATVQLPLRFLGADPNPGANYTGQPAVHAYYEPTER
jgi:SAM-dependent methyltransferase